MDVHGQVSALRNSWRNSINIFTDIIKNAFSYPLGGMSPVEYKRSLGLI